MPSFLAAIERHVQRFIEGPIMRLFGAKVEPSDLAKHLSGAMEDHRVPFSGKFVAPNRYELRLSQHDFDSFREFQGTLLEELADYLVDLAPRRQLTLLGRPQIAMSADPKLTRGQVEVSARLEDPHASKDTRAFTVPFDVVGLDPVPSTPTSYLVLHDRTIPLMQAVTTLGRSIDNDVILEGDDVSRHHAQITRQNGKFVLTDLKSANGTLINGRPLKGEAALRDGDSFSLAAITITFRSN